MALKFLIFLTLYMALNSQTLAQPPEKLRVEHIGYTTETTMTDANAILEDKQGFLWFGGSNGLARFDGYEFKIYRNDTDDSNSLNSNLTLGLLEDSADNLWVITFEGLNLYNRDKDNFSHFLVNTKNTEGHSRSNICQSLLEDRQKRLWIGTFAGINIFDLATRTFINTDFINDYIGEMQIISLYQDSYDNIWIGTKNAGAMLYQPATNKIRFFAHNPKDSNSISGNEVKHFVEDDEHNLWIATTDGLDKLNPLRNTFTHYRHNKNDNSSLSENFIWRLYFDSKQNLWITTDSQGINIYDKQTDSFRRYYHDKFNLDSISTNKIRNIYEDKDKGIWISSVHAGIDYISPGKIAFDAWRKQPGKPNSLVDDSILAIHEDSKNRIWIGTEGGLSLYDPNTKIFKNYRHDPENNNSLSTNAVLALDSDKHGNIWIGTWSGGLSKLNPENDSFQHYLPSTDKLSSEHISSKYVWSLYLDSEEQLWIGTEAGYLDVLDTNTGKIKHYGHPIGEPGGLSSPFIRNIHEDEEKKIWIATDAGISVLNRNTGELTNYQHINGNKNSLLQNNVWDLFQDSKNRFWVATDGSLSLFNRETETFTHFTQAQGLVNDSVIAITEDTQGMLWLATLKGVSRFSYDDLTFRSYTVEDGLASNTTNRVAILNSKYSERVFIGSVNGLSVIDPKKLVGTSNNSNIVFTQLKVNNKVINKFGPQSPLKKAIGLTEEIRLNYEHKMMSINFTSLDFGNQNKIKYRYRLEGFDKEWIETHNEHSATYTNIPAGQYTLLVSSTDTNGKWREQSSTIRVVVQPGWWATTWAYLIYLSLTFSFIYAVYRMQYNRLRFEKEKVSHFKYIDKIKNQILANTSHELRTPLNGIIGLADALSEEAKLRGDNSAEMRLKTITTSGKRLANLVNDILDFSKLEEHSLSTAIEVVDVYEIVTQIFDLTAPLIANKKIELINNTKNTHVYADEQKLQQILLNLVSNAIKFTDSGKISVDATKGPITTINISDSGVGIPPDQIDNIFESFQQVSSYRTREHGGTGLGLAISKKLVILLGGDISVKSKLGEGTTFSFTLRGVEEARSEPKSKKENNENVKLPEKQTEPSIFDIYFLASLTTQQGLTSEIAPENYTILMVDDDPVNRMVLSGILAKLSFNVLEASDGYDALEILAAHPVIDVLILDIMMPRMSGFEVCERIRSDSVLQNLPILFLSANTSDSEVQKAFELGGNGFVSKPIQPELLKSKIYNCLSIRYREECPKIKTTLDPTTTLRKINRCLFNGQEAMYGIQLWVAQSKHQFISVGTDKQEQIISSTEALRDLFRILPNDKAIEISKSDIKKVPEFKDFKNTRNIVYKTFTRKRLTFVLLCYQHKNKVSTEFVGQNTIKRTGQILAETFDIGQQNTH